jgi:DNA-directed RNA polymerase subunit M/transcription elongation factor TFIIS
MNCPKCKAEIPARAEGSVGKADKAVPADRAAQRRMPEPEDAVRADAPPAPCPQCGWSTMWNE